MRNKDPRIVSLRAVRKVSHIGRKATRKSSNLLERVEHKTTLLIVDKAGSVSGAPSVNIKHLMYDKFPYMTPIHPSLPVVGQKPSVTVFAFLDPKGFYGGIATLLLVAAQMANELGYDLRVTQTTGYSSKTDVLKFLKSNGIEISNDRFSTLNMSNRTPDHFSYLPLHKDDVIVVSAWWDAYIASMLPLNKKFVYLIQDYEPIFYNNGDLQQFAESTYHTEKFIPICNTELLYKFFKSRGYNYIQENADWFEPAVGKDAAVLSPDSPKRKIFLYARPSVDRNLFYTALEAIEIALSSDKAAKYNWEIYSAGQSNVATVKFSNGTVIKNLGKMDLEDYYKFARTVDVAISPMLAPHPNYPTLELASLGAMVVSTKYETKQNLDVYCKNILMADPTATSMADSILKAVSFDRDQRIANLKLSTINSDWKANLTDPLARVIQRL